MGRCAVPCGFCARYPRIRILAECSMAASPNTRSAAGRRTPPPRRLAFTVVELLVTLGIISLMLGLLLPALNRARESAKATVCAANLREIGRALLAYGHDNGGFVPRDHTPSRPDRRPPWVIALGTYARPEEPWPEAMDDAALAERLARETQVLQCPSHPLVGEVPGCFVVNAFKFESQPTWDPDGPVKLAKIQNSSEVIWAAEAADVFGGVATGADGRNQIYDPRFHDVWEPGHLPRAGAERVSDDRHAGRANLLFFDASVRAVRRGGVELRMFDDGVTERATPPVFNYGGRR